MVLHVKPSMISRSHITGSKFAVHVHIIDVRLSSTMETFCDMLNINMEAGPKGRHTPKEWVDLMSGLSQLK